MPRYCALLWIAVAILVAVGTCAAQANDTVITFGVSLSMAPLRMLRISNTHARICMFPPFSSVLLLLSYLIFLFVLCLLLVTEDDRAVLGRRIRDGLLLWKQLVVRTKSIRQHMIQNTYYADEPSTRITTNGATQYHVDTRVSNLLSFVVMRVLNVRLGWFRVVRCPMRLSLLAM